jgi:hypothetical protein
MALTLNNEYSEKSYKNRTKCESQGHLLLALSITRSDKIMPFDNSFAPRKEDMLHFLMFSEKKEEAANWLLHNVWQPFEMDLPFTGSTNK